MREACRQARLDTEGRVALAEDPADELLNQQKDIVHPNCALELVEAFLYVDAAGFAGVTCRYAAYLGRAPKKTDFAPRFGLGHGRVTLLNEHRMKHMFPKQQAPSSPAFIGYAVTVSDLAATRAYFLKNDIPLVATPSRDILVPSSVALGATIVPGQAIANGSSVRGPIYHFRSEKSLSMGDVAMATDRMHPSKLSVTLSSFLHGASSVEPTLITASDVLGVLEELKRREPIFHKPEFGTTRRDFEQMTDDSFWEVGASGRRYSREFVLDALESRTTQPEEATWRTAEFHCAQIAPDNFLLTYTLHQGVRVTRRATIWRRTCVGWKIVYHQGTVVGSEQL